MTDDDIEGLIPCRKTVHDDVQSKADEVRAIIREDIRKAKLFPDGFSCTTDMWTDDVKHRAYLALVAHINLLVDNKIERKRLVLSLNEVVAVQKKSAYHLQSN